MLDIQWISEYLSNNTDKWIISGYLDIYLNKSLSGFNRFKFANSIRYP
jgi:hypothetical protein